MSGTVPRPLRGVTVLDLSRMLPGAVLARMLLDMGARVIKIEKPGTGDPMRHMPPLVGGVGAGFCAFFRGAESLCLDLRRPGGVATLIDLARHADVLVESFRPGTLEGWGADPGCLLSARSSLVICSLTGFAAQGPEAHRVGHDVNFVAAAGLLSRLPGESVPAVQVADVVSGLLACSAVLAALLECRRTGRGMHVRQPLLGGPLPLLTFAMADAAAGGESAAGRLLAGTVPAYRLYRCGDGRAIAVGALEPKFWRELVTLLGLEEIAGHGLDAGPAGERAARRVERVLRTRPREAWLALARERNLPVTAVDDVEAAAAGTLRDAGLIESTPVPGGGSLATPGPWLPAVGSTPLCPAPLLGEHTAAILRELGIDERRGAEE